MITWGSYELSVSGSASFRYFATFSVKEREMLMEYFDYYYYMDFYDYI